MHHLRLCILLAALCSGLGYAQLGESSSALLEALEGYDLRPDGNLQYTTSRRDSITFKEEAGVLQAVSGKIALTDEGIDLLANLLTYATHYPAEEILEPLRTYLREDAATLIGEGEQRMNLGRDYLWHLEMTRGFEGEGIADFSLEPAIPFVVDADSFPEASHRIGAEDARYVIREFSDFQCPYCTRFATGGLPLIKAQLLARGDVRFEFHHFPLNSIHPNAAPAAEASLCLIDINGEEAFWDYHDALFARQSAWASLGDPYPYFVRLARDNEFEAEGMLECLQEGRYSDTVEQAYQAAVALGIRGTPTVFVNGVRMRQDYNDVNSYLDIFRRLGDSN